MKVSEGLNYSFIYFLGAALFRLYIDITVIEDVK